MCLLSADLHQGEYSHARTVT